MQGARELIGSLTQARIQLIAAKAILEEAENEETDDKERYDLNMSAQKISRCLGVIADVREEFSKPNQERPAKQGG